MKLRKKGRKMSLKCLPKVPKTFKIGGIAGKYIPDIPTERIYEHNI